MTHISEDAEAARESARTAAGQFGDHTHSAPELGLGTRVEYPVFAKARRNISEPVAYPANIPAGGAVEAGLEDSGGVFVSIEFPNTFTEFGDPVRVSLGGQDDKWNEWNSIQNEEPTGLDDETNTAIVDYLREVRAHVDGNAEAVRWAATEPLLTEFAALATGNAPEDHDTDEAMKARTISRGESLVTAFASGPADEDERAADAIADILVYARSKGLDVDELLRRAESYAAEE